VWYIEKNFGRPDFFHISGVFLIGSRLLIERTEPDAKLVRRARRGDLDAFNALVSRWEKRLYNYLLRLLGNREDALDACQEAFFKAYRNLGALEDAEKFPQWLFRIAHNLAFSQWRHKEPSRNAESWPDEDREGALVRTDAVGGPGPAGSLFAVEVEFTVAKALASLPAEQREAIVLKVYYGFQFTEIAEIMSCPLSTAKSRIYAGMAQLKDMLAPKKTVNSD
jgi:RNA polymerase sigma-70 factor (ECF subfamily)